ncbi:MAG TPA: DNA primase [Dissulfurispiraceae bacterium]|nr:DNA primase [Dissulfurispiraceae bacterium]
MRTDNVTEEIRSRIDIVDLVSQYVELKRAGQNFKGLCPFHSEKTPSFTVNPSRQIFHCFGCNKGGDIFTFLMERENLSFQEVLASLAEMAGVSLERSHGPRVQRSEKDALLSIQKAALAFFREEHARSAISQQYVKERGLNAEIADRFALGYTGNSRDGLYGYLKKTGFAEAQTKASGLVHFGERGPFDFFRDRLIFPIQDLQGRVIAFGGRIMSAAKDLPKYINSPESTLFKKSDTVYGLHLAKQAISEKGYALITEGYLDTIICHQFGFPHAVAPLGTALTAGHVKKLRRFAGKAVFVFDGDKAGIAAARRAVDIAFHDGMTVKIALLPQGEDPDTLLRKQGDVAFRKYLGAALSPVEFILQQYGRNMLDGVRAVLQLLAVCPDGLIRDASLRELSERSRIHEATVREELRTLMRAVRAPYSEEAEKVPALRPLPLGARHREEEVLLSVALAVPEKREQILKMLEMETIEDGIIRGIFEKMHSLAAEGELQGLHEHILAQCSPDEQATVSRLLMQHHADEESIDKTIADCGRGIAIRLIARQIHAAEAAQDEHLLRKLYEEKKRLQHGRR